MDRYEAIWKSIQKHGYKYDYRELSFNKVSDEGCFICSVHGKFYQRVIDHYRGSGCSKCANVSKLEVDDFKNKSNIVHNGKYDYSLIDSIKNNKTKVPIICNVHGIFYQRPNDHLNGCGCPKCSKTFPYTTETVIETFKKVHGNEYDYSMVEYQGIFEKVAVICPKHGIFYVTPNNHINGSKCPYCNVGNKSRFEDNMFELLFQLDETVERQKTFDWLKYKRNLYLDYYLPKYNVGVEIQGEQHFKAIEYFGGDIDYQIRIERDNIKKRLCEEHGIKMFYITKKNYNINEIKDYISYDKQFGR